MNRSFRDFTMTSHGMDRRGFLKGVGASGALLFTANWNWAQSERKKYGGDAMPGGTKRDPKVFIAINPDGTVDITCARSEMGQGIRSSLALVVADEMEADWDRCRVVQAPGDEALYGNQNTDGSRSMRHWYMPMRYCGAAARLMLEQAAADRWGTQLIEVRASKHSVIFPQARQKFDFGELASRVDEMELAPGAAIRLKRPSEFRYIGKDQTLSCDADDIVSGTATYGADIQKVGMVYAVVARPPVFGSKMESCDDSEALKVDGVLKVMPIEGTMAPSNFKPIGGVAVVAENTWAAIKGREALKIKWSGSPNDHYDSQSYRAAIEDAATKPGKAIRSEGDFDEAFASASKTHAATYYLPHIAHAPMEPPVATALLKTNFLEVWAPTQAPEAARTHAAERVGLPLEKTRVNVTLLGGGFGRKSKADFVNEAVEIAKAFPGRAARVQWTREDDIRHDYFHTVSAEHLEASLDRRGKPTGWLHRSVAPTIVSIFSEDPKTQAEFESNMGHNNIPFAVPNVRIENPEAAAHTRIGWFRSVSNIPRAFAVQCFISELAEKARKDPLKFYLELLGEDRKIDPGDIGDGWNHGENPEKYPVDTGRLRKVLETAAKEAGWGKRLPKRRGMGLAVHYSFVTYVAAVLEVEVEEGGNLVVHKATMAVDCGPQINPDRIRSQMEGSCVMGIGLATTGEVSFADGTAQQSNFHDYTVPRISSAPKSISVHLVDPGRNEELGGVGEPGVPPIAPALCNAIYAATGKRIRQLPIGGQLG